MKFKTGNPIEDGWYIVAWSYPWNGERDYATSEVFWNGRYWEWPDDTEFDRLDDRIDYYAPMPSHPDETP